MNRFFILLLTLSNTLIGQTSLQTAIQKFADFESFTTASISVQITDLETGLSLGSYEPYKVLSPASTIKLFSTATALEILGPDYKPTVKIYMDGEIVNDVLIGNLYIKGGGDASLGSSYFNENPSAFLNTWVEEIKKLGIQSIQGQIIADGSDFGYMGVPDGWAWNDMGNYYGAGPAGLCIYDNRLNYFFETKENGMKSNLLRTFPILDTFLFLNNIYSANVNGDNSYIYGAPYSNDRLGIGNLPLNKKEFLVKGSLPDPERQLAQEFHKALLSNDIFVLGGYDFARRKIARQQTLPKEQELQLIYTHYGTSIFDLATLTNHKSINLFAEQLLCLSGYYVSKNGSTDEGLSQVYKYWKPKMNTNGLFVKDGSGLSRSNSAGAGHFCELLFQMSKGKNAVLYKKTLPIAGESGTVSSLCKGTVAQGRVYAKSGTMNRIKSYSGYIDALSGKKLAFAIIVNNFTCSSSTTTEQIEKLLVEIVKGN